MATPFSQTPVVWAANLTFTTNFFGDGRLTGHLWSLAVEEQFYLFWPATLLWLGLAAHPRRALWILSLPLLVGPVSRVIQCKNYYPESLHWFFGFRPATNYVDALALGCAGAILWFHHRARLTGCFQTWSRSLPGAGVVLVVVPMLMAQLQLPARLVVSLGPSMQAAGLAILLLDSLIAPEKRIYQVLNYPLVRHLGVLSYSIYIWQQIFCNPDFFGLSPRLWWLSFPGFLVPVLLVAHLSYYGLEMPFFRLRKRYRHVQNDAVKPAR